MAGCKSCGEKGDKGRHFPPTVIEINNPEQLVLMRKVLIPASMGTEKDVPASIGKYRNVLLVYEANNHIYLYSSDGIPTLLSQESADLDELWQAIHAEENTREMADTALGGRISAIEEKIPNQATAQNQLADKNFVNSSVATNTANFIGTFNSVAELEAYSGTVTNNDYAFVIVTDAQGNTAYDRYKYNGDTEQWMFEYELNNSSFTAEQWAAVNSGITSGNVTKLAGLANIQTIGANLTLANGELSATDTTYTHFTGATASADGTQGLVPGPLAGDEDKYLKGDGTWGAVQAGPTVVQTTGTSTTDVMSQNATTSMVYADPATRFKLQLGKDAVNMGNNSGIAIGSDAFIASGTMDALAVGHNAAARATNSVAIGAQSNATAQGEMSIGNSTRTDLYNNTGYRLLTGLYDPQSAHDAATKGYVDTSNSYSATETATGGTWVDGSPIYKKTISIGALPDTTIKTVAHGISGLKRVIKAEGYAYNSNSSLSYPLPFSSEIASTHCIGFTVDDTYISVGTGENRSNLTESYITLYYTKSA